MSTGTKQTAKASTITERLAAARLPLDAFERQPPLGARAYIRGRNARRAIIVELEEESDHD